MTSFILYLLHKIKMKKTNSLLLVKGIKILVQFLRGSSLSNQLLSCSQHTMSTFSAEKFKKWFRLISDALTANVNSFKGELCIAQRMVNMTVFKDKP